MKGSLSHLDYCLYRMARLLSEYLDLGELLLASTGSLPKEGEEPAQAPEQLWGDSGEQQNRCACS